MSAQRTALVILLLIETAAFAFLSETVAYPAVIAMATLAGWTGRLRFRVSHDRAVILTLGAAVLFALKWRLAPYSQPDDIMFYLSPALHAVGQFLLGLQAAALFIQQPGGVLPVTLPWWGVFVMVSAGDRTVSAAQRAGFQGFALAFVTAAAVYFGTSAAARSATGARQGGRSRFHFGKTAAAAVILVLTAGIGWAGAAGLHRYERALDQIVAEFLTPEYAGSQAGFPSRSRLGSIVRRKSERSAAVALRIVCDRPPDYLRGRGYHWLHTERGGVGRPRVSTWTEDPTDGTTVSPHQIASEQLRPIPVDDGRSRFLLTVGPRTDDTGPRSRPSATLEIWPDESLSGVYFLPPNAASVVTSEPLIARFHQGVVSISESPAVTYEVRTGRPAVRDPFFDLSPGAVGTFGRSALVEVPEELTAQFTPLADRVFAGCRTPAEHLIAAERYFRENYRYELGIRVPYGEDPIVYFLSDRRPAAHCEYFAQGAALLLRLRGIPTRYMTGFVVPERNPYGGFWIARNEHAHAWCEAWVDGRGWVIVEATPAAGVPAAATVAPTRQMWESVTAAVMAFRIRVARGGWRWLMEQTLRLLASPPGWLLLAALVTYIVVRMRMRRTAAFGPAPSASVLTLHRLLRQADRRATRLGLTRLPGETVLRFADRLRDAGHLPLAGWYTAYAAARYAGPPGAAEAGLLHARWKEVPRWPRRRKPIAAVAFAGSRE